MNETPQQRRERIDREATAWQIRLTSGDTNDEDRHRFAIWRQQSDEHRHAYAATERLWQNLAGPLQADRQRRRASARHARFRRYGLSLGVAASLLLIISAGIYPDYLTHPWADYRTRIGEQRSITLADGSTVHLNTDTAIEVTIHDQLRRVELLRGEAEFDVAHDSNRPFRVITGATATEALGTRFIVRYDGAAGAVTLLQGKVRGSRPSTHGAQAEDVILAPGQRLSFDTEHFGQLQKPDIANIDAWRRGRLIANFIPLGEALAEINRYRRVPIRLLNAGLTERQINIAVDLDHIDDWLNALQQTLPVKVFKAGPWVFLQS